MLGKSHFFSWKCINMPTENFKKLAVGRWRQKLGSSRAHQGAAAPRVGRPPPTALANGQLGEAPSRCPHPESTCIFKL